MSSPQRMKRAHPTSTSRKHRAVAKKLKESIKSATRRVLHNTRFATSKTAPTPTPKSKISLKKTKTAPVGEAGKEEASATSPRLPIPQASEKVRAQAEEFRKLTENSAELYNNCKPGAKVPNKGSCLYKCSNPATGDGPCDVIPYNSLKTIIRDPQSLKLLLKLAFGHQKLTTLYYIYLKNSPNHPDFKPTAEKTTATECKERVRMQEKEESEAEAVGKQGKFLACVEELGQKKKKVFTMSNTQLIYALADTLDEKDSDGEPIGIGNMLHRIRKVGKRQILKQRDKMIQHLQGDTGGYIDEASWGIGAHEAEITRIDQQPINLVESLCAGFAPFVLHYDKKWEVYKSECELNITNNLAYWKSTGYDEQGHQLSLADASTKSPSLLNIGYKDLCPPFHKKRVRKDRFRHFLSGDLLSKIGLSSFDRYRGWEGLSVPDQEDLREIINQVNAAREEIHSIRTHGTTGGSDPNVLIEKAKQKIKNLAQQEARIVSKVSCCLVDPWSKARARVEALQAAEYLRAVRCDRESLIQWVGAVNDKNRMMQEQLKLEIEALKKKCLGISDSAKKWKCEQQKRVKEAELLKLQTMPLKDPYTEAEAWEEAERAYQIYKSRMATASGGGWVNMIVMKVILKFEIYIKKKWYTSVKDKKNTQWSLLSAPGLLARKFKDFAIDGFIFLLKHPSFMVAITKVLVQWKMRVCRKISLWARNYRLTDTPRELQDQLDILKVDIDALLGAHTPTLKYQGEGTAAHFAEKVPYQVARPASLEAGRSGATSVLGGLKGVVHDLKTTAKEKMSAAAEKAAVKKHEKEMKKQEKKGLVKLEYEQKRLPKWHKEQEGKSEFNYWTGDEYVSDLIDENSKEYKSAKAAAQNKEAFNQAWDELKLKVKEYQILHDKAYPNPLPIRAALASLGHQVAIAVSAFIHDLNGGKLFGSALSGMIAGLNIATGGFLKPILGAFIDIAIPLISETAEAWALKNLYNEGLWNFVKILDPTNCYMKIDMVNALPPDYETAGEAATAAARRWYCEPTPQPNEKFYCPIFRWFQYSPEMLKTAAEETGSLAVAEAIGLKFNKSF